MLGITSARINIKQLPSEPSEYRKMFKDTKVLGETNFVLSVGLDKIYDVLNAAREIDLMTDYNNYLIGSLDIKQLDLTDYMPVNISGLSLSSQSVGRLLNVEQALLSDAVHLFMKSLADLEETQTVTAPILTCESKTVWAYGTILMNIMKVVNFRALTGFLRFDQFGRRSDFDLDIVELRKSGLRTVCNLIHDLF